MENRNININDVVEHRRHSKRAKLIFSGKQILFILNGGILIFVDFHKLFPHSQLSSSTRQDLPTLFSHRLHLPCASVGSFIFDGRLFILGGQCSYYPEETDCFDSDTDEYGLPRIVFEVDLELAHSNSSLMDFLIPSKTIPRMNDSKHSPIVETIENRVYVLNCHYHEDIPTEHHFEALAPDKLSFGWRCLPNPCFIKSENGIYNEVMLLSHYVLGSMLYVLAAEHMFPRSRWYFFDTEKETWHLAEDSNPPWFGESPVHFPFRGKFATKLRLGDNRIMISFNINDEEDDPESSGLFATLITREGKPICYQEMFSSVFPDLDVGNTEHLHGSIVELGNDLFCAIFCCYDSTNCETFMCFSKFELRPRDEDGCRSAAATKDGFPQESHFLDVFVGDSKTCRTNEYPLRIDAAHLLNVGSS